MKLKEVKKVKFKDLEVGTIFREWDSEVPMIKIDPIEAKDRYIINAIVFGNNEYLNSHFNDNDAVIDCIHSSDARDEIFKEFYEELRKLNTYITKDGVKMCYGSEVE